MLSMSDKKCSEPNWYLTNAIHHLKHTQKYEHKDTRALKPHIDIFLNDRESPFQPVE